MSDRERSGSSEAVSETIFDHLVELAALELPSEEGDYLRRELNNQLRAIRELEAIEVDPATPITSHGVPYTPEISRPPRPDEARPCAEVEAILGQAPETDGRYIVVPDIPHTDLE
jgi:aspartyl/glutamyl-tRNA(Asn/Gln) amidotransferase C subunit